MEHLKHPNMPTDDDRAALSARVTEILDNLRERGETAVRDYSREFDDWDPESFRVSDEDIERAGDELADELKESIQFAQDQVRNFARLQRETMTNLEVETRPGVVLGHKHIPVDSVGVYVPGGRYTLIASSYMGIIPARVAGVERVVMSTPPMGGRVPPGVLYSANLAGADAIYSMGGVQALAAMVYGLLPDLDPVDMLIGPGNAFVVEAKRQLFGNVGIDLLAGPTEIGIIADDTADAFMVACDLVGQAEHDPRSRAILITTSRQLGQAVIDQMDDHLSAISTEAVARQAWEHGGEVILVDDEDELVRVCDDYAIEHIEVLVHEPKRMIDILKHYGSLFVGEETTVAYGDKVSGPNHVLPTHRAARFTGGLWVGKFLKTVTYQYMDKDGSREMAQHCETEALAEGMVAHARTASIRLERYAPIGV